MQTNLEKRVVQNPDRYKRRIDAILLDDAISIVTNPALFTYFREPLFTAFPNGALEAKTFLKRLLEPRNKLSHANSISLREAEWIICDAHDTIESIKQYYRSVGMGQQYDVPLITKITDSFGSIFFEISFPESMTEA